MTLLCFLLFSAGAAGSTASTLSLNGAWQFALARDAAEESRLSRFHEPGFDAGAFRPIPVPSNWAMLGFEEPMYGHLPQSAGTGFYLHRFPVPRELAGRRVLLHFDGVWSSAEVWLNGRRLGRHDSGFTSFAFEVQEALRPGEENILAVQVRQVTRDYLYDVNDDWSLGGIFRDVWLEWMPAARYIDHVDTWTTFDGRFQDADLHIRVLVNQTRKPAASRYQLRAVLAGAGEVLATSEPHYDTGREHLLRIPVRGPRHWTAETPNLYPLRVELLEDGVVVQAREHRVGFRQVATEGGVLRLNGRPIRLRGVCRHDQHPEVGIATRRKHWLEDLRLMKDANVNAIRMVHYPPAPGFLDLCDEMGFYILDEAPMGYGGDLGVDPSYAASALLRTYETVARDRNHPSVIIWDVGNENPVTALHLAALRYIRGNDPTRPALFPWHAEEWLPADVGILAPHYPTAAQARALVARADRPVVATEYSHALLENGFGDHADKWEGLTSGPAGAGGTIWMWQDQGLWQSGKRLLQIPNGSDGIVNADRTPQRDFWEAKAVYAPVRVLAETLPSGPAAAIPIRNDFDFTDLENVTIRWTQFSGEREAGRGETRLAAPPGATASLNMPVRCESGRACYAHLVFLRPDGGEITRRSVEFTSPPQAAPKPAPARLSGRNPVTLKAKTAQYEFDPATGLLTAASCGNRRILAGVRPVIWRPLNANEQAIYRRRGTDPTKFADLDPYSIQVKRWTAAAARIEAETEHRVNERNTFGVRWTYTPLADGSLEIAYVITPRIEVPWIPEAGVELAAVPSLATLRWEGLGPHDAFPNLKAGVLFGTWSLDAASPAGVKADVRWAEWSDGKGGGLRLEACGFLRLPAPGRLRVLAAVEGRPAAKFQRAEKIQDHLDARPISGRFILRPLP